MTGQLPNSDWRMWSTEEQLMWIEQLSSHDLMDWLREVVWMQKALPLTVPPTAMLITHLSDVLRRGSASLFTRIRVVVPKLLQEWGRDDPGKCLDDLLILCGTLRCASAESTIALIITDRLKGRQEEVALRQRCLSVLSGLGCTDRTAPLFRRYIENINYTALSYRALYRYDLSYAVTELPTLVSVHSNAGATHNLRTILNIFFFDYLKPGQRPEVWKDILKLTMPQNLEEILKVLQSIDIVLAVPFRDPEAQQVLEVIYEYSSDEPHKGGDKIDTTDIGNQTVVVLNRALESFLMSSKQVERAVMAASG